MKRRVKLDIYKWKNLDEINCPECKAKIEISSFQREELKTGKDSTCKCGQGFIMYKNENSREIRGIMHEDELPDDERRN